MNSEHPEPILLRDLEFATIDITDQEKKTFRKTNPIITESDQSFTDPHASTPNIQVKSKNNLCIKHCYSYVLSIKIKQGK